VYASTANAFASQVIQVPDAKMSYPWTLHMKHLSVPATARITVSVCWTNAYASLDIAASTARSLSRSLARWEKLTVLAPASFVVDTDSANMAYASASQASLAKIAAKRPNASTIAMAVGYVTKDAATVRPVTVVIRAK